MFWPSFDTMRCLLFTFLFVFFWSSELPDNILAVDIIHWIISTKIFSTWWRISCTTRKFKIDTLAEKRHYYTFWSVSNNSELKGTQLFLFLFLFWFEQTWASEHRNNSKYENHKTLYLWISCEFLDFCHPHFLVSFDANKLTYDYFRPNDCFLQLISLEIQ